HLKGVAAGVQDVGIGRIQDTVSVLVWSQPRIPLCSDDDTPSEGAHLFKEHTRLFPHAQGIELVDDEERVDAGTAALRNVVHKVVHQKSAEAWGLLTKSEAANAQIHGIGILIGQVSVKLPAHGVEEHLVAHP